MYYQNRVNQIAAANSYEEIFANFKTAEREVHGYRMIIDGNEFIFVQDDNNCGGYVRDVAVVNQTEGYGIGSIWLSFNDKVDFMVDWLKRTVSENQKQLKAIVPVEPLQCWCIGYTCDCCGERFHSNSHKQTKYGLGKGLGICADFEKYTDI
jgi:hypothetical protein